MHKLLHVSILVSTLLAAAGLALLLLWPLVGDSRLPAPTQKALMGLVLLGALLLVVEWRFVH